MAGSYQRAEDLNQTGFWYMARCNAYGIRIYPVLVYGRYVLEVEFNKTKEFIPRERLGEPTRGQKKYSTHGKEWSDQILALYEELYRKKVMPKLGAA